MRYPVQGSPFKAILFHKWLRVRVTLFPTV